MREFSEQELVRREKMQELQNKGIDPFGHRFDVTSNSKEIKGAKITIKDSKGVKVIEYISSNKPQTFAIPAGTYTLTEKIAPAGYQKLLAVLHFL